MPINCSGDSISDFKCVEISCEHWGGDNLCMMVIGLKCKEDICIFDSDIYEDPEELEQEELRLKEEWDELP